MDTTRKHELLVRLTSALAAERGETAPSEQADTEELWDYFRACVNTRPPMQASDTFLTVQDELLRGIISDAGIATLQNAAQSAIDDRLFLWRGDITTLKVDAIVNAANSQMLGCWIPGHFCIDNAIHTFAGVQLRYECNELMQAQGHEEPTAQAKVTQAWNLPCKRIIHTVGPIAMGSPTELHSAQLGQCYEKCLDAAAAENLHAIAFCGISTGVFGFPAEKACKIAVETVRDWLDTHQDANMQVVFNVFSKQNELLYQELLRPAS